MDSVMKQKAQQMNEALKQELSKPVGRFISGARLHMIRVWLVGGKMANGLQGPGLIKKANPKSPMWSIKVSNNLSKVDRYISALNEMVPELSKEAVEYDGKAREALTRNAPKGEQTMAGLRKSGNMEIYQKEVEALNERYSQQVQEIEARNEVYRRVMSEPLIEHDFDLLRPEELHPDLTPDDVQVLAPMIEGCRSLDQLGE